MKTDVGSRTEPHIQWTELWKYSRVLSLHVDISILSFPRLNFNVVKPIKNISSANNSQCELWSSRTSTTGRRSSARERERKRFPTNDDSQSKCVLHKTTKVCFWGNGEYVFCDLIPDLGRTLGGHILKTWTRNSRVRHLSGPKKVRLMTDDRVTIVVCIWRRKHLKSLQRNYPLVDTSLKIL